MESQLLKIKRAAIRDVANLTYRWRSIEFAGSLQLVDPNTISLVLKGPDDQVTAMEKEMRKNGYIIEEVGTN
jgi:hypothetical protein